MPDAGYTAPQEDRPARARLRRRERRSALLDRSLAMLLAAAAPAASAAAALPAPAAALAAQAQAQASEGPVTIDGLGTIAFPVSGTGEAADHFLRGVLLLHSFEYDDAAAAFREAQAVDPGFAMAYWGEAMTYTHPVWNEQDAAAARAALARLAPTREARLAAAPTQRERAWLGAVEVLYGEGAKEARDTAYALAMGRLAETYPEDFEAAAFHALALLGLSQGERDVPTYMRAGAIALALLEENPGHPGAAHYVIHAFDDPTHAPIGLRAARAYSRIAPDAAHAQHMTSHIFLARGMWEDVVAANERAMAVVNAERGDDGYAHCGHYNEWLAYGYQQQGRLDDALALVRGCLEAAADPDISEALRARRVASFASMRAWYIADSDVSEGFPVVAPGLHAEPRAWSAAVYAFGGALAAARRGDLEGLRAAAESVTMARPDPGDWGNEYEPILLATLGALVLTLEGDLEGAAAAARSGAEAEAALPVDFGPPLSFKPPRELEGEILLRLGRPAEALEAFELALGRTPNRAATLRGHALATKEVGRIAEP